MMFQNIQVFTLWNFRIFRYLFYDISEYSSFYFMKFKNFRFSFYDISEYSVFISYMSQTNLFMVQAYFLKFKLTVRVPGWVLNYTNSSWYTNSKLISPSPEFPRWWSPASSTLKSGKCGCKELDRWALLSAAFSAQVLVNNNETDVATLIMERTEYTR